MVVDPWQIVSSVKVVVTGRHMTLTDLTCNGSVAHDGTGDELRKHRDVKQQVRISPLNGRLAAIDIDEIGDGLKRIEADTYGQGYLRTGHTEAQITKRLCEKAEILENREYGNVAGQTGHKRAAAVAVTAVYEQTDSVVDCHRGQHEEDIDGLSPSIEYQGESDQHPVACPKARPSRFGDKQIVYPRRRQIADDEGRNEHK